VPIRAANATINRECAALKRLFSLALQGETGWGCRDRIHLQQVLLNLVVNAFDAMAEVTGRPRKVILRTRALDGNRVQVDVADTGPEIAAEKLGSIFKPFVTSKAGGMGMGLSVHSGAENCGKHRL
jgi:C4-dicarboxylate-specific signal transduction histidine kinase